MRAGLVMFSERSALDDYGPASERNIGGDGTGFGVGIKDDEIGYFWKASRKQNRAGILVWLSL